jgi:hypothetical protein
MKNILFLLNLFVGVSLSLVGGISDSAYTFALGLLLCSASGAKLLIESLLTIHKNFSVCRIYASSCITQYCLGASLTFFTFSGPPANTNGAGGGQLFYVMLAFVYILMFCLMLLFLTRWDQEFWRGATRGLIGHGSARGLRIFWLLILVGQLSLLATGQRRYEIGAEFQVRQLPIFAQIVGSLSVPLWGMSGWIIGAPRARRDGALFAIVLASIPIEFVWILPDGRRMIAYNILIFAITFIAARGMALRAKHILVGSAVIAPTLLGMSSVFFGMRKAIWENESIATNGGLAAAVAASIDTIRYDRDGFFAEMLSNVTERSYIIGFIASIIERSGDARFALGQDLLCQVIFTVPSILLPGKFYIWQSLGGGEYFTAAQFGLYLEDAAKSLIASSFTDFGPFGWFLYPFVVLSISKIGSMMTSLFGCSFLKLYGIVYFAMTFVVIEEQPAFYFVRLRDFVIALVVFRSIEFVRGRFETANEKSALARRRNG